MESLLNYLDKWKSKHQVINKIMTLGDTDKMQRLGIVHGDITAILCTTCTNNG